MQTISYKHSVRARHLRITITSSGECVVTIPKRVPMVLVHRFVTEKAEWIQAKQALMRQRVETPFMASRALVMPYKDAKEASLAFVRERVRVVNERYGFSYKEIRVKNQKTRWGSCSKQGNLNFNYRMMYLPVHLADYIVAHELCHLKEFHHGEKFWNLVAHAFPNHREMRKELRGYRVGE